MRGVAVLGLVLVGPLLSGCGSANVYDMPPEQVFEKLIALEHGTPSVIKVAGSRRSVRGVPAKSVTWTTDSAHSFYQCTAWLTPVETDRTSINIGCDAKNASGKFALVGAASKAVIGSAADNIPTGSFAGVRHRYIELVDSTLDGRPFDNARAGSQVMGWPDAPSEEGAPLL